MVLNQYSPLFYLENKKNWLMKIHNIKATYKKLIIY